MSYYYVREFFEQLKRRSAQPSLEANNANAGLAGCHALHLCHRRPEHEKLRGQSVEAVELYSRRTFGIYIEKEAAIVCPGARGRSTTDQILDTCSAEAGDGTSSAAACGGPTSRWIGRKKAARGTSTKLCQAGGLVAAAMNPAFIHNQRIPPPKAAWV